MAQKPPEKRKSRNRTTSGSHSPPARLATPDEIAEAAGYLEQMSQRGYGDATELNISAEQKRRVAQTAVLNALGN